MRHVPIDHAYTPNSGRVKFLAPYYRERFGSPGDTRRIPTLDSLEVFAGQKIGVELDTWPDIMLLAAEGERCRDNVVHFASAAEAIEALAAGQAAAVYARASCRRRWPSPQHPWHPAPAAGHERAPGRGDDRVHFRAPLRSAGCAINEQACN
jgi:hypothetical protein